MCNILLWWHTLRLQCLCTLLTNRTKPNLKVFTHNNFLQKQNTKIDLSLSTWFYLFKLRWKSRPAWPCPWCHVIPSWILPLTIRAFSDNAVISVHFNFVELWNIPFLFWHFNTHVSEANPSGGFTSLQKHYNIGKKKIV